MWKKIILHRAQSSEVFENVVENAKVERRAEVDNLNVFHLQNNLNAIDLSQNNNRYRASLKNGELVRDEKGPLVVTHNYIPIFDNNNDTFIKDEEYPLDLSVKLEKQEIQTIVEANPEPVDVNDSGYITNDISPCAVVDLTMKSIEEPTSNVDDDVVITKTVPGELQIKYPYLKMTNTGALVLWNFLWALLQDANYTHITVWYSVVDLQFKIVNSSLLAKQWGIVKRNHSMDWRKIKKILDLYLRKNLIRVCSEEGMVYQFLIVPRHVKQNMLGSEK